MATTRTCDRCGSQDLVKSALVSTDGTDGWGSAHDWSGDLCGRCRLRLEQWLKPIPEGPQKRTQEEA